MVGVTIIPNGRREWRSRGATRYWIVAPWWTDVEIKKPSHARRQIADCWVIFFARRLKNERFNSDWLKVKVGCQSGIFVYLLDSCLLCYYLLGQLRLHMSWPDWGQTTVTSQTRDFPLCHGTKVRQGVFRRTDINPAVPSCLVLLQRKERELQVRSKRGVSLIDQVHSYKQIHGGQKRPLESHKGINGGHRALNQALYGNSYYGFIVEPQAIRRNRQCM